MPDVKTLYVVQYQSDGGTWIDLEDPKTRPKALESFEEYKKKIPKHYSVRLLKRVEEVLGIRVKP